MTENTDTFKVSSETIEPSDKRDEFVKSLQSECAKIRERAWALRKLASDEDKSRRDFTANAITLDDFLRVHDAFTAAEDELSNMVERLEHNLHAYNRGRPIAQRVYISHTAEGLPIRVSTSLKIPLWGN